MADPWTRHINGENYRLCVWDIETDPFAVGRVPKPFCCGFYDGITYHQWWGDHCIDDFILWLDDVPKEERFLIYAHNGGRFDFFYIQEFLDSLFMLGARIARASFKQHEFRDSFAAIPVALGKYQKTEIDYAKFERGEREKHKAEILAYLKDDCLFLHEFISKFRERFGDKLTMASAAMAALKENHKFNTLNDVTDEYFRQYFYGGRVQTFEIGKVEAPKDACWNMYDVNSEYPFVMANYEHPLGDFTTSNRITPQTFFAQIEARNFGALPSRNKYGIDFTRVTGKFWATIHEINAGLDTNTLEIRRVIQTINFKQTIRFEDFVMRFYNERMLHKEAGDTANEIFCKLIMNGAYGKFAQNPRAYKDWTMSDGEDPGPDWTLEAIYRGKWFFSRPQRNAKSWSSYFNVAIGASITGAARSYLLRGLADASRPIYCDTDSIMCLGFQGRVGKQLGEWKFEGHGDTAYIAGKKMYALMNGDECVKMATKGVRLTPQQIMQVAEHGETVIHRSDVPTYKIGLQMEAADEMQQLAGYGDDGMIFQTRAITRTGEAKRFGR